MRRLRAGLVLSAVAHGALLLAALAAFGSTTPRLLFVDLVEGFGLGARGSGGGGSSGDPGPRASAPPGPSVASAPGVKADQPRSAPQPPRVQPRVSPQPEPSRVARDEPRVAVEPPREPPSVASVPAPPIAPTPLVAPPAAAPPAAAPPSSPSPTFSTSAGTDASVASAGTPSAGGTAADAAGSGADGRERGARVGQGGSGSGGGLGTGVGARQGSAVALAVPGDGGGEAAEYEGYFALLRSRLHEALRYPTAARRRGLTGTVHIDLDVAPSGAIGGVVLVASSSHRLLDEAALDAVRGLGRVPFPPGLRPRPLRVRLPVVFDLR